MMFGSDLSMAVKISPSMTKSEGRRAMAPWRHRPSPFALRPAMVLSLDFLRRVRYIDSLGKLMATPAARFINIGGADDDAFLAGNQTLGAVGRIPTAHAYGQGLSDV